MRKVYKLAGERFGRLLVIERTGEGRHPKWLCTCDCGGTAYVAAAALVKGLTKSCGCLHKEDIGNRTRKHGMSRTLIYSTWTRMLGRCYNDKNIDFQNYGGRGIQVCQRWTDSFESFLADMGLPPSRNHSIDRIENDGNYEPGNCRWAIKRVQANNTRANVYLTFQGETKTLAEWSQARGLPYIGLAHRIRRGWPVDLALTKPFRDGKTPVSYR